MICDKMKLDSQFPFSISVKGESRRMKKTNGTEILWSETNGIMTSLWNNRFVDRNK